MSAVHAILHKPNPSPRLLIVLVLLSQVTRLNLLIGANWRLSLAAFAKPPAQRLSLNPHDRTRGFLLEEAALPPSRAHNKKKFEDCVGESMLVPFANKVGTMHLGTAGPLCSGLAVASVSCLFPVNNASAYFEMQRCVVTE